MLNAASSKALATQARRIYIEALLRALPGLIQTLSETTRQLLMQPAEYAVQVARRDGVNTWQRHHATWHIKLADTLRQAAQHGVNVAHAPELTTGRDQMSLVDDDTIEREIHSSRLALSIMDKATWEFSDLRNRISMLEQQEELSAQDLLRAHVVARIVLDTWHSSGLTNAEWQMLQTVLHDELSLLTGEAYHETNRWLVGQNVLPEVDLRPMIRRTGASSGPSSGSVGATGVGAPSRYNSQPGSDTQPSAHVAGDETRVMTRAGSLGGRATAHAEAVLGRLNRLIGRQLPEFVATQAHPNQRQSMSPKLTAAMDLAEEMARKRVAFGDVAASKGSSLLEELQQRKQTLKKAAETPAERATIEIVALLFQAILTEERIPASMRVWFARLQMPVLRVAVSEPDFFAATDHPARRLIDRMGACVMGFNASAGEVGQSLEKEIKRVVQVVEAYPDTGRRVFQTVLTEFEKFLDHYFKNENLTTRKGVSLAQQVEQRETLAIQFTIELRKMLNEVPVQDGVREFLFQVWADVLAVTAVRSGPQADATRLMKRAAADLIWSASAKVSREERAEVIRRLPPLLKTLREGMGHAGLPAAKQDEYIRTLNNSLAAAFTAKAAAIPRERLEELMEQLEALEEMLPESEDVQINESMVRDLSGHESEDLEVVADGGTAPTPAMLAWARELQVGSWYMLDYRGRNEPMQLAWRGMRRQLALFVSPQGRGVLFQLNRMAAFLQAGLLLPAQDESLTVRATRTAMEKLEVDPTRLLG
ncbi:MAG: DUF1631 family protein [Burkholderiaceae bacterium]|nr:DUF1631 family protein [Burkholderiaceae bacterium]